MTARTQRILAGGVFALTVAMSIVGVALIIFIPDPNGARFFAFVLPLIAIVYVGAGALLVDRLPDNRLGWVVIGIGFFQVLNLITSSYGEFAFRRAGNPLALGGLSGWASGWTWAPSVGLLVTFLILLFPDGRPPTPRWRWVAWLAAAGIGVGVVGLLIGNWSLRHGGFLAEDASPTGVGASVSVIGFLMVATAAVASVASLIVRFRRSEGDERQQLRWFLAAAGFVLIATLVDFTPIDRGYIALGVGFFLFPICIVVAVLKYHLYDINFVIKKAAVALTVTLLIGVPILTALAIASQVLLWNGTAKGLTLAGGVLLGLCVVPLLRIARRMANRVVYGRRATSYEVLADFSQRMAETYATDDVLSRMAEILRAGTGAAGATVWLRDEHGLRAAAVAGSATLDRRVGDTDELTGEPRTFAIPVHHHDENLGGLSVAMAPDDPIDAARERLVRDLAAQAGLVLRNVRLIEDLKSSRQRLVAAQDEERRKIERNLHDGAQQQLVALAIKQRLVASLIGSDDQRAREMVGQLEGETNDALESLRDLARGIYPPLLADKGLPAALEAQARRSPIAVAVEAVDIGRFRSDVEATVYFCALEALNDVAKYAEATSATIRLANGSGELRFEVYDDGRGFDPTETGYGTGLQGMSDRLAAVGGSLSVDSRPGHGTTIAGRLPVEGLA
jgi:signal transduction histidine kinase